MFGMDPFATLYRIQRALETHLDSDWLSGATTGVGAFPPINLFQQGHDFVAVVELAGVKPDALNIEAKENSLRLSGSKFIDYEEKASLHRRERIEGSFDRTITLPVRIDPDRSKPSFATAFSRYSSHGQRAISRAQSRSENEL